MNNLIIATIALLCLAIVDARHFTEQTDSDDQDKLNIHYDNIKRARDRSASEMRRRKRRYQSYDYEYPRPAVPFYAERMDYNRNQDLLPQILRLLDDISVSLRRQPQPPPLPQPIYVPYPVPYPVPQQCNCPSSLVPNITDRINMEDQNQNWGLEVKPFKFNENGDGSRPISLVPLVPERPLSRPAPKVEHGSSQAGEYSTQAPQFLLGSGRAPAASAPASAPAPAPAPRAPGMCNAAVLSCCGIKNDNQKIVQCFNNLGCGSVAARGNACDKTSINAALESFKTAYSPS